MREGSSVVEVKAGVARTTNSVDAMGLPKCATDDQDQKDYYSAQEHSSDDLSSHISAAPSSRPMGLTAGIEF